MTQLKDLAQLRWLVLDGPNITDASLAALAKLPKLSMVIVLMVVQYMLQFNHVLSALK